MERKWIVLCCMAVLGVSGLRAFAHNRVSVVFGQDDRKDLHEIRSPRLRRLAQATASFFSKEEARVDFSRAVLRLPAPVYGEKYALCRGTRFYSQPAGALFSGALVGPDLILTAGHAVRGDRDCAAYWVVFGYDSEAPSLREVPLEDVFRCKRVVTRRNSEQDGDYALIQLDRAVEGREPFQLARSSELGEGTPLILLGYPSGLPLKVAGGAKARRVDQSPWIEVDTDSFGGNSGSPAVNARTGLLEGILVDGSEDDYVETAAGCYRVNRCPQNGCASEVLTRASAIQKFVP